MKKIGLVLLSVVFILTGTSCGGKNNSENTDMQAETQKDVILGKNDLQKIEDELSTYPEEINTDLANDFGLYVNFMGKENSVIADSFFKDLEEGIDTCITLVKYTEEGDACLFYLSYKDNEFFYVEDLSRDSFSGTGSPDYYYGSFKYIKKFPRENLQGEMADFYFLVNEMYSTYDEMIKGEFRTDYMNGLYVFA